MNRLIIALSLFTTIGAIWPPEYKVDLKHEEEFVISEPLQPSDVQDIYDEEELIKETGPKVLKLQDKYFRLHSLSERRNSMLAQNRHVQIANVDQRFPEFNPELEDARPWLAGFVDENNGIIKDQDTVYFEEEAKIRKLEKRNVDDYNYDHLKAEYDEQLKGADSKNDTAKYEEVKEEETPQEAVNTLVNFAPSNCTGKEESGMGLGALKCLWSKSQRPSKHSKLKNMGLIAILCVVVYCVIVLPLWCQYGWCCCCCRCKFCRPRDQIEEVKMFFMNNPPGIYHDQEGDLKKYRATTYEIYAQKKLEKAIQQL